jgi:hypothetical protein
VNKRVIKLLDVAVYMAHILFNVARGLVQTACISLNVFFSSMGLTICFKVGGYAVY